MQKPGASGNTESLEPHPWAGRIPMTFSLLQAGARGRTGAARTLLRKAEERVDDGGIHLKMDEPLFAQRLISERELQLTRELTAIRGKEVPEARDRLKLLEAGNRPEEIDATAAGLNRLKAQRTYVGTAARVVKSASPVDGIVISHRLREKVGQAVKKVTWSRRCTRCEHSPSKSMCQ